MKNHIPYRDKNEQSLVTSARQVGDLIKTVYSSDVIDLTSSLTMKKFQTFQEVLNKRRTKRHFRNSIRIDELSTILHFSSGISGCAKHPLENFPIYFSPSAGGLRMVDIYVLNNKVTSLDSGAYFYDAIKHKLVKIWDSKRDVVKHVMRALSPDQTFAIEQVAVLFLLVANYKKAEWRYGRDFSAYLSILDSGCMAENIQLVGVAINLNTVMIGYIRSELATKILNLNADEEALCAVAVGK